MKASREATTGTRVRKWVIINKIFTENFIACNARVRKGALWTRRRVLAAHNCRAVSLLSISLSTAGGLVDSRAMIQVGAIKKSFAIENGTVWKNSYSIFVKPYWPLRLKTGDVCLLMEICCSCLKKRRMRWHANNSWWGVVFVGFRIFFSFFACFVWFWFALLLSALLYSRTSDPSVKLVFLFLGFVVVVVLGEGLNIFF